MIKTYALLLVAILGGSAGAKAQNAFDLEERQLAAKGMSVLNYTFQLDSANYTPLSNPISLNNGAVWGDSNNISSYVIGPPFQIALSGRLFDSIYFYPSSCAIGNPNSITPFNAHMVMPFGYIGLVDRGISSNTSLSALSYKIDGTPGNRILKIECKEAGSARELAVNASILSNHISFQAWFYEGSNMIEFRYGPSVMPLSTTFYGSNNGNANTGPIVGIFTQSASNWVECWLEGPVGSPSLVSTAQFMIGTPANGTVYRFNPVSTTSVAEQQISSLLQAFPNPATDLLRLELQQSQSSALVQLYDLSGREVKRVLMSEMQQSVDISDLAAGMYSLRLEGAAGSLKIIKK